MVQKSGISKPDHGPPAISVPSRASFDSLFSFGTGCSPGPMTLVSNFFSDHFQDVGSASFSQLLAGAIASPRLSFLDDNNNTNINNSSNERSSEIVSERQLGFQQNRPTSLMIAQSPLFTVPPGFSPSGLLDSPSFFSLCQSPFGISHQQALAQVTAQAALSQQTNYMPIQLDNQQNQQPFPSIESFLSNQSFDFDPTMGKDITISDPESSVMESSEVTQSDRKSLPPPPAVDRPANDGYNWRKYGQKQVKASEYPRSYYKCTYLDCPVKKKVERNFDGQITEITYRGQHIHELPHPDKLTKSNLYTEVSMEETETRKPIGTVPASSSQLVASYNEVGNRREEIRLDDDDEDEEPKPKRMQSGNGDGGGSSYVVSSQKTVNESRIVVQTRSEVDLLDDGYKWRKYGQKLVKGNSYPRSYYKCTSAGCNVRKHVERASADPKAVVTTYEGKHSHDIPVAGARNGGGGTNSGMQLKQKRAAAGKKQQMLIGDIIGGGGGQILLKEEQITTA